MIQRGRPPALVVGFHLAVAKVARHTPICR